MEEHEEQLKAASEGKAPKERPVWLTQSTVQGAYNDADALKNRKWSFLRKTSSQYVTFTLMLYVYFSQKI